MPTSVTPTLATLREEIKKESRVKGADNLDDHIDSVVNELLCDYAQKNTYFELLQTNVSVPTIAATGIYDLPDDFVRMRLVRYRHANGYTRTLNPRPQYIETANGNLPRWYDLAGSSILVFNYDGIPGGDSLLLDYYSFPQTLVSASVFPIPKLVAPVKLEAIRRVLIYNEKLQMAAAFRGDSVEQETRSRKSASN